jgi:primase-polymerase (primpol)-like protein
MLARELQLPDDLTEVDQWVLWRLETRNGKPAKVPYSLELRRASTTNPKDCAEFGRVCDVLRSNVQRFRQGGVGFVFFSSDPFVGIDLDDCLERELVKPWAAGLVERFSDTYIEVSPSGNGLKIWARGRIPVNVSGVRIGDGAIELYDRARYFTVTGQRFRGAPLQIEDHSKDLEALYERLTGGTNMIWRPDPLPNGKIPHGQQHATLVSIAGTLRARRVCDEAILACLLAVNKYQCEKPGPPANIERIVRSTRRWR